MDAGAPVWEQRLAQAEHECRAVLAEPVLANFGERVPEKLRSPEGCFSELARITEASDLAWLESCRIAGAGPIDFERWLLVNASIAALGPLRAAPLDPSVKRLWAEEALFCACPASEWIPQLGLSGPRFRELAKIVTLRRYPAGQFHWEIAALPRSTISKTPLRQWPALLRIVAGRDLATTLRRGFGPLVETHVNDRRKNRLTMSEREGQLSYYRVARSVELQPEIKGLIECSWLYCESTGRVSPALAWMRRFFVENGALVAALGPAGPDAGFMIGSEKRRQLYASGEYRPTLTYVVWPRQSMLRWAALHPELADEI